MSRPHTEDTPNRILNAALEIIAEKGSDGLRTRELLERAQISNLSAVSYYFGSLEALRLRVLERYFESARPVISAIREDEEPRQALLGYCRRMAQFVLDHPALERNIVFLALSGGEASSIFTRIIQENISALAGLIQRARPAADPLKAQQDAVVLASATIYPLLFIAYGPGAVGIDILDPNAREQYFTNLADLLLGPAQNR